MTRHPWYSPSNWLARSLWWLAEKAQKAPSGEIIPGSGISSEAIIAAAYGVVEICGAGTAAKIGWFFIKPFLKSKLSFKKGS